MPIIGSKNKTVIGTLVETLQRKVEPPKLYDAMKKMNDDLNACYEALFDGPLPGVSGQNLDLTGMGQDQFPDFIAFNNLDNSFSADQTIASILASLRVNYYDETVGVTDSFGRMQQVGDNSTLFSSGFYFDGTDYQLDADAADGIGILLNEVDGQLDIIKLIATVLEVTFRVTPTGIVTIGDIPDTTGASLNEVIMINSKHIRGNSFDGLENFSMLSINVDNLVEVAADAELSGDGHFAIPKVDALDRPAPGATRNGIIYIDKTNFRLVYYINNLRYFMPIGTSF